MIKGIKIRIYPNKHQKELIAKTLGCCRLVYNRGLSLRNDAYEITKESIGYRETNAMLTSLKKTEDFAFLKEVDSIALQQSLRDLDKAYQNFFRTKRGFPKFKSKHNHDYAYRTQNINNCIRISDDNKHIKLPKLGYVKARVSYNLPSAKINNATIKQVPSGKYYVTLNVEVPDVKRCNAGGIVGIDLGIKDFYVSSDGTKCDNPKYLAKSAKKLAKEQGKLSKKIETHIVRYKMIGGVGVLSMIGHYLIVKIFRSNESKLQRYMNILLIKEMTSCRNDQQDLLAKTK